MEGADFLVSGEANIVIAGCGPGSRDYVTSAVQAAVSEADVLFGASRLLALFPGFTGETVAIRADIEGALNRLAACVDAGRRVVVLVTGDPGVCSLARPVLARFGKERCRIIPGISAVQTAFARLALDWTAARIVDAHAGIPELSPSSFAGERVLAVVGGNAKAWPWVLEVAELLAVSHRLHVCSDLSLPTESVREIALAELLHPSPGGGLSVLVWERRVGSLLDQEGAGMGRVYFVGAGPGDPDLLTRKAERLLRSCRCCIWAGSLVNPALLAFLPESAQVYDSAGMTLDDILRVMREACLRGVDVVRLHTGEPSLFGAIGEQMTRLAAFGIEYEVVPGISSFQAAAAAVRCELTCPEVSQAVLLTRAAGRTPVPDSHTLDKAATLGATLCIFLSTDRTQDVVATLLPHYGADCPAAVVYHASWPDQIIVRGNLGNLADRVREAGLTRTGMILVGRALAGPVVESRLYAADFAHGYRAVSARKDGGDAG